MKEDMKQAKKDDKKEDSKDKKESFEFFGDEDSNKAKKKGILETNMLKKEPEKALPDYKIKEILSYGDKVTEQSDSKNMLKDAVQGGGSFGELAIEVNKLEDIDDDQMKVKPKKKKHHEEPVVVEKKKEAVVEEDDGKMRSQESNKANENAFEIETSSLGEGSGEEQSVV